MGRYYNGDIDGQFFFGVQCSTAPARFGCQEIEPSSIEYYIDTDSIDEIQDELNVIKNRMGEQLEKYKGFFSHNTAYSDEILKENQLDRAFLGDYADYVLGEKIFNCVKEHGSCEFYAEI